MIGSIDFFSADTPLFLTLLVTTGAGLWCFTRNHKCSWHFKSFWLNDWVWPSFKIMKLDFLFSPLMLACSRARPVFSPILFQHQRTYLFDLQFPAIITTVFSNFQLSESPCNLDLNSNFLSKDLQNFCTRVLGYRKNLNSQRHLMLILWPWMALL